ncbi:TetR/AcrR family transcriptional regulator [Roseobacteraceae bacterium S113]
MARPRAQDHDDKRAALLSAAAEVFARDGIARASMAGVARAAGISKGNIYHYYASKDALLFDILDSYLSELRDRICALRVSDVPPETQLHVLTRAVLLAYEGMDHEHHIQTEGLPLLAPDQQQVLKGYQRDMVTKVSEVLAACAPHLARDRQALRATTMSVFGMLNWFYMWHRHATRADREAYAAHVADLTLKGIQTS